MKVLVTGGTGFVGSYLVRALLCAGKEVRVLARRRSPTQAIEGLDVEIAYGDVCDRASLDVALKGCDTLYHVAAHVSAWERDYGPMYRTNVEGTRTTLKAALRRGVERAVYTSSVVTLGAEEDGRPATEATRFNFWDIGDHYIRSKYLAEVEAVKVYREGLPLVIVNPSGPIGAFDRRPSPLGALAVRLLQGKVQGYFEGRLPLVDVEDLADGHLLAAEKGRAGERYILSTANLSLKAYFEMVGEMAGMEPPTVKIPLSVLRVAAYASEFIANHITRRPPALTVSGVKVLEKASYVDPSKAVQELGFPQNPIRASVERAVRWFKENGYA